jgi:hypothetical protein
MPSLRDKFLWRCALGVKMDYLEMWQKGFKEGKDFTLDELNKHCETNFANLVELIMYVRNVELSKENERQNA